MRHPQAFRTNRGGDHLHAHHRGLKDFDPRAASRQFEYGRM